MREREIEREREIVREREREKKKQREREREREMIRTVTIKYYGKRLSDGNLREHGKMRATAAKGK